MCDQLHPGFAWGRLVAVGIFAATRGLASTRLCMMADVSSGSECAAATCWQREPEIHLINARCCCFPLSWRTWQPPNGLEVHQIPQGRETEFPALPPRLQGSSWRGFRAVHLPDTCRHTQACAHRCGAGSRIPCGRQAACSTFLPLWV